jgi:hypothetical protein
MRTAILAGVAIALGLTVKGCTDALPKGVSVIQYDGFENRCEAAGGIVIDRVLCASAENLIELPLETINE